MLRSAAPLGAGVLGQLSKAWVQRTGPGQAQQGRMWALHGAQRAGSTRPGSAAHDDVMQLKSDEEVKAALEGLGEQQGGGPQAGRGDCACVREAGLLCAQACLNEGNGSGGMCRDRLHRRPAADVCLCVGS